jgi:aminopeptidase N
MRRLLIPTCLLLLSVFVRPLVAEEPLRTATDRPVDIVHIRLDLDVSLKAQSVSGKATIDFAALRRVKTLALDAVNHEVKSVQLLSSKKGDGAQKAARDVDFDNTGKQLLVTFPQPLERGEARRLIVTYRIEKPESGLHFFKPTPAEPKTPWMVWSQGEPTANRYWFPCLDNPNERQTTESFVTVDSQFEVLSNGKLVSKEKSRDGKWVRFHWKQDKPHVSYLVTLVVGEFVVGREEWRGMPVTYYVSPSRAADTQRTFGRTVAMLDFFSDRFGIKYPWDQYAQVVVEQFTAGGMENTSATTLYQRAMHDKRALLDSNPDWLIAHELGHQWWGDLVTCKDWTHLWLNEGFATYCEVLWAEHKLGPDERDYRLYQKSRSARSGSAKTRPIVDRHYPTPGSMFDSRAYPKGGWVLHMLRSRLGDEEFFRALKRYGTVYAYRTAETSDLRKTFERLTGESLERFFHDWTERPAHPELKITTTYDAKDGLVKIDIKQTQKVDPFHFPLTIELTDARSSGPVKVEKYINERNVTLYVPVDRRPKLVRVDPAFTLLADLSETKSRDWWQAQVTAPTVAERIRAVEHFAASKTAVDRALLAKSLASDAFYGIRVEAAKALGKSGGNASRDALLTGMSQQHPKVRRACIDALAKFAKDEQVAARLTTKLKQGDASYFVEASVISSLTAVKTELPLELLAAQLTKGSHSEVIRQAALRSMVKTKNGKSLDLLLEWSQRGKPPLCRAAALKAAGSWLAKHKPSEAVRKKAINEIVARFDGESARIRRAAAEALRELGTAAEPAREVLVTLAEHEPDRRVRAAAEAALKKLNAGDSSSAAVTKLRGELGTLQKRNKALEERLLKLEAKK